MRGNWAGRYEELRLIVAHLGSGSTVSAHARRANDRQQLHRGRPVRAGPHGALPVARVGQFLLSAARCTREGNWTGMFFSNGGLFAYLGTRDSEGGGTADRLRRARGGASS